MANSFDGGGPAFPASIPSLDGTVITHSDGMSRRDWFAGMAIPGVLTKMASIAENAHPVLVAERAYAIADAMLAKSHRDREAQS